jgi:hypothetical protein
MNRQDILDFAEGFLTVAFAGGAVGSAAFGTTFPGWYPFLMAVVPVIGLATLAGIRKINAGRRPA